MLCFATIWTVAHQAPLSMGILQARIQKWVAMPSSRESSQPRDWTQVSSIAADSLPSESPGKPSFKYNLYICNFIYFNFCEHLYLTTSFQNSGNLTIGSHEPALATPLWFLAHLREVVLVLPISFHLYPHAGVFCQSWHHAAQPVFDLQTRHRSD